MNFAKHPLPWRRKPLNRKEAWACLGINLLVCPGLGSIIAGRLAGFFQLLLAGAGLVLVLVGGVAFLAVYYTSMQFPHDHRALWTGAVGLALFAAGWTWSLVTSIQVVKETSKPWE